MIHLSIRKPAICVLLSAAIIAQTACAGQMTPGGTKEAVSFGEDWLLNTYCSIQVYEEGRQDLIREAFAFARSLENDLSRTIETSEIARFNASEGGSEISEETAALLLDCKKAYEESGGMLDITLGAVTPLWDFAAEQPRLPDEEALSQALTHVGRWDELTLQGDALQAACEIRGEGSLLLAKADSGIQLDLGAVAKGYIADRVSDFLRAEGVGSAVINFGGNVVFVGEKEDGADWICGIEDPKEGKSETLLSERGIAGTLHVGADKNAQVSVVTSGTYERCFTLEGVTYHHVLDPATGLPVQTDLLSATVTGPSSEWCDIYSTTCLLLGSVAGMRLIEATEGYEAVFILADGEVLRSGGADFVK